MNDQKKEEAYEAMFKVIRTLLNDWIAVKVPEIESRLSELEKKANRTQEYLKIGDYLDE